MTPLVQIKNRKIGPGHPPFIIAEIGINHEGSLSKAKRMITDAYKNGAECVKFQCHVIEDEMIPEAKKVIPGHTTESIWDIMDRCAFSEKQEKKLKDYTENLGIIYISTPFSRAAANRLKELGVPAYKIGSGECNNYPLIEHIASFKKPVILSTGMNDLKSIRKSVAILRKHKIPFAVLHCISMYPTPHDKANLGAITQLQKEFPDAVIGFSDHTLGNYASFAAIAMGASIIEKHFTSDKKWPGPDIALSIDPKELNDLIVGTKAVFEANRGKKEILPEEQSIINFAYACVVSIKDIKKGDEFTKENIWVKRPGNGEIKAVHYEKILGKLASTNIKKDRQLRCRHIKSLRT